MWNLLQEDQMLRSQSIASQPKLWGISDNPRQKNVSLSYPHKIDWRRLTSVWYGSLMGSETLEIYIYSSLTVWRQSIDRQWYQVYELKHDRIYICLPTCLSVCLWVCLFVYQKDTLPFASDPYKLRQCLGLKHNFFRDVPKSKQSLLVNTKKICGSGFGPPWELRWWARLSIVPRALNVSKKLIACLSVCHKPTLFFKLDF